MNCTYSDLVLAIARILQIEQSANMHEKVALQTMLLSETLYEQLFDLLSTELGLESIFLRHLFNEQIVSKHLLKSNHHDSSVSQLQSGYRLKEPFMRKQSLNAQNVQNIFVTAIKQALIKLNYSVNGFTNHHQLCVLVNEHLKNNNSSEFWSEIRKLIPEKTEIQLREYYQKSFMRHMYEESISIQDKIILCDLMKQMASAKPSKIADEFVRMVGTGKYFQRNVIMYVVNKNNQ
ncbi:SANT/Myb_domain [Hexamita inflata]|uniref:SANT/Myb domain n=1 Tax=Hexamita inflata TaxID=28002 RepID=A0AA86NJ13_9EUKA|nr:SANT/Myb domain [Hexamita inflata]